MPRLDMSVPRAERRLREGAGNGRPESSLNGCNIDAYMKGSSEGTFIDRLSDGAHVEGVICQCFHNWRSEGA